MVADGEILGNVDAWFYGNSHSWAQRHTEVDEGTVVNVHANVMAETVGIQLPHQLDGVKKRKIPMHIIVTGCAGIFPSLTDVSSLPRTLFDITPSATKESTTIKNQAMTNCYILISSTLLAAFNSHFVLL